MMTAAERLHPVTVDDYLAGELTSEVKHEYLSGFEYAMAGGRVAHNRIATNIAVALESRLHGQPCQPFNSDIKIRVQFPSHTRFYYPDVSVVSDSNPPDATYQDRPVLIAEVLSRETRRTDEAEKKEAYLTISSLQAYLLIEQDSAQVTVYRRGEQGFDAEVYSGLDATIPLVFMNAALPLQDVYAGVDFVSEESSEHGA
jgi:Uma2 family endonuclease